MTGRAEHYVIANGNRVAVEDGDRDLSVAVGFALPANSHPTHAVSPRSVAPESLTHAATVKSHAALLGRLPLGALVRLSPEALEELDRILVGTVEDARIALTGTDDNESGVSDYEALEEFVVTRA